MKLPHYQLEITHNPDDIRDIWEDFDAGGGALACGYPAFKAWCDQIQSVDDNDTIILMGKDTNGSLLFLLPLVRKKFGPFSVLTRPAMKHLAYYRGLFSPEFERQINHINGQAFWQDVLSSVEGIDALWIDGVCEPAALRGHPMSHLDYFGSSNPCHIMHIESDWEAQYNRIVSAKKRSNDRRMIRLINEVGNFNYKIALSLEEKLELLSNMFAQKRDYFTELGQPNPFASDDIKQFYLDMLRIDHESLNPRYTIAGIYAGDELLASILGGRQGDIFHGMIISRTMSELARYSPGRLLLIEMNRHLSSIGIKAHNFGTGEFDYKNGWCDEVMKRRHVTYPVTPKGKAFIALLKLAAYTKKLIKEGHYQHHPVIGKMRTAFGI